ncbi:glycosyltransferase [Lentisphaerota bacterium WC36G]|nr:hypothetical protein LJT99_02900 [Lentisphaerae bacterium WC36]
MKSLIHCVWTGASFPFRLRQFIKNWTSYLRQNQSDFQIVVWLTDDSLAAAIDFLKKTAQAQIYCETGGVHLEGIDLNFIEAKLNHHKFFIGKLTPLFELYSPVFKKVVSILHSHQYYTSISNIARVLIVNHCGGIYTDVDYLSPNSEIDFPKNIDELIVLFKHWSEIDFYLPATKFYTDIEMENQCVILSPHHKGSLEPLIKEMIKQIDQKMEAIEHSAAMNQEFLTHELTQQLAKSMFADGELRNLLELYRRRDEYNYSKLVGRLYKGLVHQKISPQSSPFVKKVNCINFLDRENTRHFHYEVISKCTFEIVVNFFEKKLKINTDEYFKYCWSKFRKLFSTKSLDEQFLFTDKNGEKIAMYTWSNPGYGRLSNLEKAVGSIEKNYIPIPQRISLSMMCTFICQVRGLALNLKGEYAQIYSKIFLSMQDLLIKSSNGFVLSSIQCSLFLHDFLVAVHECSIMEKTVELLNNEKYQKIKMLINPEHEKLSIDDIESFIRT